MSTDTAEETQPKAAIAWTTPKLAKALAAFQGKLPKVAKNKTGKISGTSKSTGKPYEYTYKYADLADVVEASAPIMSECGLSFSAKPTFNSAGHFVLAYALRHESGEQDAGTFPLPNPLSVDIKQVGIAITYARRYVFTSVMGIVTDEDTDVQGAPEPVREMPAAARRGQQRAQQRRAEQPPQESPDMVYRRRQARMFSLFNELGLTTREATLAFVEGSINRKPASRGDMTIDEVEATIKDLEAEQRTQQQDEGPMVPEGVNEETGEVNDPWNTGE